MWDLPRLGIKAVSPAMRGGFYCATRGSPKLCTLRTDSTSWPSLVLLYAWPLSGATGHKVTILWERGFGGAPELFFPHGLMDCFSSCDSKTIGF